MIRIEQGDLTKGDSLVLVNASNTNGALGSGVSGAIRRTCGEGFQEAIEAELKTRYGGPMAPGDLLMTAAGSHPRARWVAHLAVMDYRSGFNGGSFPTEQTIRRCCENLWRSLETLSDSPVSVAMPALGVGTGQLGVRLPTAIACETLKAHLKDAPISRVGRVTFYGYSFTEYAVIVGVVSRFFQLPEGSVPAEALELGRTLVKEP